MLFQPPSLSSQLGEFEKALGERPHSANDTLTDRLCVCARVKERARHRWTAGERGKEEEGGKGGADRQSSQPFVSLAG